MSWEKAESETKETKLYFKTKLEVMISVYLFGLVGQNSTTAWFQMHH